MVTGSPPNHPGRKRQSMRFSAATTAVVEVVIVSCMSSSRHVASKRPGGRYNFAHQGENGAPGASTMIPGVLREHFAGVGAPRGV